MKKIQDINARLDDEIIFYDETDDQIDDIDSEADQEFNPDYDEKETVYHKKQKRTELITTVCVILGIILYISFVFWFNFKTYPYKSIKLCGGYYALSEQSQSVFL